MSTGRRPILLLVNPSSGGKPAAPGKAVERPEPEAMLRSLRGSGLETDMHILAEGDPDDLDELERHLWQGPSGARVDQVAAERGPASGEYQRFEIGRR